jgi:D-alanyl-D-alanine dipeptidase
MMTRSFLRRTAWTSFAPTDRKAPPGHCTGGARDARLLGPGGHALDLTSPHQGWAAARTHLPRLTPRAARHRRRLVESMLKSGFSNCHEEYWHYYYGDAARAVRSGSPFCSCGRVEPPSGSKQISRQARQ